MKTGIYMIRNKVNDKKYIGQAVDIDKRWGEHIKELNNNQKYCNPHLQNAWNKYGADNFEFTIICQCLEQDLDRLEIHYIAHFDTYNNGYNLTLGGDGVRGYKWTDEQRARHIETMNRPEVKKKRSESNYRRCSDPEYKAKISQAMNRPEVKAKISQAMKEENKRRWSDPEYKAKLSQALKGKPKSEEWKIKHSEARKGKGVKSVYCVTNDTIYASTVDAGKKLGIDQSRISYCCNGKNILPKYPDGHHYKKGRFKDSPVYEFWFLDEYEEKFGKVAI